MIDINELRRKISSGDIVDHVDIHANVKPVLTELLDRLEAAEKDIALTERVIDSLWSELNAVAKERDALRARVEAMELECDAMRTMIRVALEVLDNVHGNINPERGYADELETDVKRAIAALSLYNAKGEEK